MSEVPTLGSVARKLLLMELFVCFVPIVVLFSVVVIMAPLQLYVIVATGPQTRGRCVAATVVSVLRYQRATGAYEGGDLVATSMRAGRAWGASVPFANRRKGVANV